MFQSRTLRPVSGVRAKLDTEPETGHDIRQGTRPPEGRRRCRYAVPRPEDKWPVLQNARTDVSPTKPQHFWQIV